MARNTILAAATLAALAGSAGATALWGPSTGAGPGHAQTTTTEFRWSPRATPVVWTAIDDSFANRFSKRSIVAIEKAFDTWSQVRTAGRDGINPAGLGFFDLESTAVHEIGHAIGLTHPDTVPGGKNYGPAATPNAAPWLNPAGGAPVPAGNYVMKSTIGPATTVRDLRSDDANGVRFLYDIGNVNASVPGESPAAAMIAGLGSVVFAHLGVDDPGMGINNAIAGLAAGANIDIFARRFSKDGVVPMESDPDDYDDDGEQEVIEIFRGGGETLAFTRINFLYAAGSDGAGIIGTRVAVPGGTLIVGGVDIVFNKDVRWHVPAPGPIALGGLALAVVARRRRDAAA